MVRGLGVTLLEASHLYTDIQTDRQTDRYLHCTVSLTWVVRGLGVTLLEASHLYTASLSFGRTVKTSSFSALPKPLSYEKSISSSFLYLKQREEILVS